MDEKEFENYVKAGKICAEVREWSKGIVKKGKKVLDIAEEVEKRIVELGGKVAFPANVSMNEIAAHYTPTIGDENVAEGLLKLDFGVEVEGHIADNAISFDLTEDGEHKELLELNKVVLDRVLDFVKNKDGDVLVSDIGNTASNIVSGSDFRIIKNLSGHSLDKDSIHSGLTISNYENENGFVLEDMAIAIEPFLTSGKGEIFEGNGSDIFMLENFEKQVRDVNARKILSFIKENYRTKPFCKRWLKDAGFNKIDFSLGVLVREGIVHNFAVLIEKDRKAVSQFEHTVVFFDGKVVVTTASQ